MNKTRYSSVRPVTPSEVRQLAADCKRLNESDFEEIAFPTYSHPNPLARWIFWQRHRSIMRLAGIESDDCVLDFGTGTGALLPWLCASSSQVHATDLRDEIAQLLVARRQLKVQFHAADNLENSIGDGSCDVIIAADVLEHIEEPELSSYLALFYRKLSSKGRLMLSIPTENLLYKIGRTLAGFSGKGDYHRTGIRQLQRAASENGFVEEKAASIPAPGPARLFCIARYSKRAA